MATKNGWTHPRQRRFHRFQMEVQGKTKQKAEAEMSGLWRIAKMTWTVWRAKRRAKKDLKKMRKRFWKSKTTQNVAGGTVVGVGGAAGFVGIFAALRGFVPDAIFWDAEQDVAVAAVITYVLLPLWSRLVAAIRARWTAGSDGILQTGLILLCVGLTAMGFAGCKTTQHPDGTVVTEVDAEALQAVVAMTLDSGDRLLSLIAEMEAGEIARDQAELEQRLAQWQYAYELAVDLLERVQGLDLESKAETLADLKARLDSAVKNCAL